MAAALDAAPPGIPPRKHVLLFPFMAQGHFFPFLELAHLIKHRTSCTVTVVNTPLNVKKLRSALPPGSAIRLAELPFCSSDHGLPPDSESTDTLPRRHFLNFFLATEALQTPFERLVSEIIEQDGQPPLCIIADFFFGWTVDTARRHGIHHAAFSTGGAYGTAVQFSLWLHLPHLRTDSDVFSVPGFPDTFQLHRSQLSLLIRQIGETDPALIFLRRQLSLCLQSDAMLCNSVEEIEKAGVEILGKNTAMPVWCIGPLLPPSWLRPQGKSGASFPSSGSQSKDEACGYGRAWKEPGIDRNRCIEWLDRLPPSSVVYISFGSQNSVSLAQMKDLALGLEASGQPFIWVIRQPMGCDDLPESQWLPEGFEERVGKSGGQGLLVKGWGPQLEILSHESTGAFVSHCGWNSVMESLSQGVPILGWPLTAEQFYNSMLLEEIGVGVEMARGLDDGGVPARLESALGLLLGGTQKGEEMRKKAVEMAEVIKASAVDGGAQDHAIHELLRFTPPKGKIGP